MRQAESRRPMERATPHLVREVIIVGSGPAGLTAAIYAGRAGLAPLVVEGSPSTTSDQPGGQLMLTTEVENFPGFPDAVMGPELMARLREQAERQGAEILTARVSAVDLARHPFRLSLGQATYEAKAIIVGTGARSLSLGVGEERWLGKGVSTCATCDGFFFRNQPVAVVGGGDTALEEALFLTKFAQKVTVIHRRARLRASRVLQTRAFANERIEFLWEMQVEEVVAGDVLEAIVVSDLNSGLARTIPVKGLFVAIGHRPDTALFTGILETDAAGYLITAPGTTHTSVAGVFACGAAQDRRYRQAVTAAGSGCMAALDAERWLNEVQVGVDVAP